LYQSYNSSASQLASKRKAPSGIGYISISSLNSRSVGSLRNDAVYVPEKNNEGYVDFKDGVIMARWRPLI